MPCCVGSPSGILTNLTALELTELEAGALLRLNGGQRTSMSGGAKSSSKEYPMSPMELLREIKYARQQLGIIPGRVSKTYGDFTGVAPFPVVAGEQV